jgi:hypothetical protein
MKWRELYWRMMHSDLGLLPHQVDAMTPGEIELACEGEKAHRIEGFRPMHPEAVNDHLDGLRRMTMAEHVAREKAGA